MAETRRAERGGGIFGEGQSAPPHQLEGLGERCECELPQRNSERSPCRPAVFFYIWSALDGFSWPSRNAGVPLPLLKEEMSDLCKSHESSLRRMEGLNSPKPPSPVASRLHGHWRPMCGSIQCQSIGTSVFDRRPRTVYDCKLHLPRMITIRLKGMLQVSISIVNAFLADFKSKIWLGHVTCK